MAAIISKTELKIPYFINGDNPAATLFDAIFPIADAGNVGDKPLTIPDLLDNHDISMTYGTNGALVDDGDMLLADNGNGSTNTYGTIANIDDTWATNNRDNSRIWLVDCVFKSNSNNYQYLIYGAGFVVYWTKSTNQITIQIDNKSSHHARVEFTAPADGTRLVIAAQLDKTNDSALIVVNGVKQSIVINGNPFSDGSVTGTPTSHNFIGRKSSWEHYYGWDSQLNFFAFGYRFLTNELTEAQLIELSNNPYDILQSSTTEPLPELVASASIELPSLMASAAIDYTLPAQSVSASIELPSLMASATIDYSLPSYQALGTAILPALVIQVVHRGTDVGLGCSITIEEYSTFIELVDVDRTITLR